MLSLVFPGRAASPSASANTRAVARVSSVPECSTAVTFSGVGEDFSSLSVSPSRRATSRTGVRSSIRPWRAISRNS
jgi:hypothetical protein